MLRRMQRPAVLVGSWLLLAAVLIAAVPPKLDLAPQYPSLLGDVLIASPQIGDPRFTRTVILVVRHGREGALGITINRLAGEHPVASLLADLGETDTTAEGTVQLFAGGPVQLESMFVVHSSDYRRPETIAVTDSLSVTSTLEVVRDIGHGRGPHKKIVAFGYAGWGAQQLEAELARNDWFTAHADSALVFDVNRDSVWEEAMGRRSRDL
jgi:putative transcriptional regulator